MTGHLPPPNRRCRVQPYPQAAFPYEDLLAENGRRGKHNPEKTTPRPAGTTGPEPER